MLLDIVSDFAYCKYVKTSEFMRWLKKQGVQFESRNGTSHHTATLGDKTTTIPVHPSKEIGTGLAEKIKKQLGLK